MLDVLFETRGGFDDGWTSLRYELVRGRGMRMMVFGGMSWFYVGGYEVGLC